MADLKNKVIVITGAAGGLGRALAGGFSKRGCHLALVDLDFEGLVKLKNELDTTGMMVRIYKADVGNEAEIRTGHRQILEDHHRVDILVNNAGISISRFFEETEVIDFKRLFDVNFFGMVYTTKYFLPDIKQSNKGHIVNIISDFALMGFPGKTAYASSKSAVMGFTNALKTELAGTSVKLSLVIPPPLATGIVKTGIHISDEKRRTEDDFLKRNGMPLNTAAEKIIAQIIRGKYRIVIGPMMFWIDVFSRFFPTTIHNIIGKNKKRIDFI